MINAHLDHPAYLIGGGGEDHRIGEPSLARGAVGVEGVGGEVGRARVEVSRPDRALEVSPRVGIEHAGILGPAVGERSGGERIGSATLRRDTARPWLYSVTDG
jgi:hypothetical protein